MSFLIYFFVLLVSAASVLFGLDLVSAPLPKTPNVPLGRSVQVASAPSQQQRKKEADERALTPVHPAAPGSSTETRQAAQTTGQQAGSASPQQTSPQQTWMPPPESDQTNQIAQRADDKATAAPTEPQRAAASAPAQQPATPAASAAPPAASVAQAPPAAPPKMQESQQPQEATQEAKQQAKQEAKQEANQEAKLEPTTAQPAATQPAAQQASRACNIQACGARYSSFRALDCSYQPYGGERRTCTIGTGGGVTASAAMPPSRMTKPRPSYRRPNDELSDVERIVRHQPLPLDRADDSDRPARPGREMTEVERIVRHMTRDSETDIPVQGPDGQIIIVRKSYR